MDVRDAVGGDTEAVADLLGTSERAAGRLVRDRHALVELLASPVRFADSEGVAVEAFPDGESAEAALAAAGFERAGETEAGPRYVTGTSGR